MNAIQTTRIVASPATLLCRCFCRHYVTLTGAGFAASVRPGKGNQDQDGDND